MIRRRATEMTRQKHSTEFKEQALRKARERAGRTLGEIAEELNMSLGTLKGWLRQTGAASATMEGQSKGPQPAAMPQPGELPASQWTAEQRLAALNESHALSGPALHAWCRERGLFAHQLAAWRAAFCAGTATDSRQERAAFKELQSKHEQLQRELRRKERALAEAAALLVLQKKFQALLGDEGK
jgi:transposase-like protein